MNSPDPLGAGLAETCFERVDTCLDRARRHNDTLRALITVDVDGARAEASRLDADFPRRSDAGPAAGLIVTLKDNIDTAGLRTTIGSRFFAEHIPDQDAEVTRRIRKARGIILGKANMHELAFGATSQNPHYGGCRNPWDINRIPGGSSGGSAVSVAAGMCEASLGSDTGGSIRIPAALNGVVGLRPTFGRISNRGSMPSSPHFDTIGPLARTAVAAAVLYEAVAGFDPLDSDSADIPMESLTAIQDRPFRGVAIGVPAHFLDQAEPEIADALKESVNVLRSLGAQAMALKIREARETHDLMACVVRADAAKVHLERLTSRPELFGADVLSRFRLGLATTSADYAAGLAQLGRWTAHVKALFEEVDCIVTPTVGFAAPPIGTPEEMTVTTHALTQMTFVWSFAGTPAISVPCGFTADGLPIGMQLIGRHWSEATLLAMAAAYQDVTDHHWRRPPGLAVEPPRSLA